MGNVLTYLSRLLTLGTVYAIAILLAVLVGCLADAPRRADARRVLALLLRHPLEPDARPRAQGAVATHGGKGSAELPTARDVEP